MHVFSMRMINESQHDITCFPLTAPHLLGHRTVMYHAFIGLVKVSGRVFINFHTSTKLGNACMRGTKYYNDTFKRKIRYRKLRENIRFEFSSFSQFLLNPTYSTLPQKHDNDG